MGPARCAASSRRQAPAALRRPGHWATGERAERHRTPARRPDLRPLVIGDRSRLAYVALHGADTAELAAQVITRAAAWTRAQGCLPCEAMRTDNALVSTVAARRSRGPWPAWGPATSASRRARRVGTARSSASSRRSTPSGPTLGSGARASSATAPWDHSFATTTAADLTPRWATDRQSVAFTKSGGKTASAAPPPAGRGTSPGADGATGRASARRHFRSTAEPTSCGVPASRFRLGPESRARARPLLLLMRLTSSWSSARATWRNRKVEGPHAVLHSEAAPSVRDC